MAGDPVCGMNVEARPAAAKIEHRGVTFYFCSPGCHRSFVADPQKYLKTPPPRGTDAPRRGR